MPWDSHGQAKKTRTQKEQRKNETVICAALAAAAEFEALRILTVSLSSALSRLTSHFSPRVPVATLRR